MLLRQGCAVTEGDVTHWLVPSVASHLEWRKMSKGFLEMSPIGLSQPVRQDVNCQYLLYNLSCRRQPRFNLVCETVGALMLCYIGKYHSDWNQCFLQGLMAGILICPHTYVAVRSTAFLLKVSSGSAAHTRIEKVK